MTGEHELDQEWMFLILEALSMGITVEEIRDFLTLSSKPKTAVQPYLH